MRARLSTTVLVALLGGTPGHRIRMHSLTDIQPRKSTPIFHEHAKRGKSAHAVAASPLGHHWLNNMRSWTKNKKSFRSSAFPGYGSTNVLDSKVKKPWRAGPYRSKHVKVRTEWIVFDFGKVMSLSAVRIAKPGFLATIDLQTSRSVNDRWTTEATFDVVQRKGPVTYSFDAAQSRYWRLFMAE